MQRPGGPAAAANGAMGSRPFPQQGGGPGGLSGPASLLSPAGPGMQQADWEALANRKARAVPWWILAIVFVVVVGLALGVTFLVSKAF
jgi:hypothetical protein